MQEMVGQFRDLKQQVFAQLQEEGADGFETQVADEELASEDGGQASAATALPSGFCFAPTTPPYGIYVGGCDGTATGDRGDNPTDEHGVAEADTAFHCENEPAERRTSDVQFCQAEASARLPGAEERLFGEQASRLWEAEQRLDKAIAARRKDAANVSIPAPTAATQPPTPLRARSRGEAGSSAGERWFSTRESVGSFGSDFLLDAAGLSSGWSPGGGG